MWFRGFFTNNLGLKFIALILSALLWYQAVGRERAEVGLSVPLELVNIPKNMVIAGEVPDSISIRIRGSVALTRQVQNRKLRYSQDMSRAKPGPNQFSVLTDVLDLPRGLEITQVTPSNITVKLEGFLTKKLSLLPVIKGEVSPEYMIEDITLVPKQLEVKGPESQVKALEVLWTEPIDITGLNKSTTIPVKPALPDVSMILTGETEVKAQIRIGERIITRTFKDVPVEVINTDKAYKIDPPAVTVSIRGPINTMKTLSPGKGLHVRLDLAGLGLGRQTRKALVSVPMNMQVEGIEPESIIVQISKEIPTPEDEHKK
ncbi:MAG: CdaR family protein [Pseudomonadota bacterium]